MKFELCEPPYGYLPIEVLRTKLDTTQWEVLRQHGLCLACLDGNAFGEEFIEQYMPEAYANLWANSALTRLGVSLPNLYPSDATEASFAGMMPSHPQHDQMTPERRHALLSHFKVDPRGNERNLLVIIDKATAILGTREAALDWIDHYSQTLEDHPRRLSSTTEGTNAVLLHLSTISRHGTDA